MRLVWITAAPILPPLPVKDWGSNSAVVDYVRDSLLLSGLGILTNLINKIGGLIKPDSKISRKVDSSYPAISIWVVV